MKIHVRRLLLVLLAAGIITAGAFTFRRYRIGGRMQAAHLMSIAGEQIERGDFGSAKIELDKVLKARGDDAQGHLLMAQARLAGKDPARLKSTDTEGLSAIRSLLAAVKLEPDLLAARKPLVAYFLTTGNLEEAAEHAKVVVRHEPGSIESRYALASRSMDLGAASEGAVHVDALLKLEDPPRPRTVWLLARLADASGRDVSRRDRAIALCDAMKKANKHWTEPSDLLALADLSGWQAARETNPVRVAKLLSSAVERLESLATSSAMEDLPPRFLLTTINRLLPPSLKTRPASAEAYQQVLPRVEALVDGIFARALAEKVMDPAIYVAYGGRLKQRGREADAVAAVRGGIEHAQAFSPEARQSFCVCDLWLAEHFLEGRRAEDAQPHLEALLANERFRGYGQMLVGRRELMEGRWDAAAAALVDAVARLPKDGAAHALLGLCQLRRGFVSEGRHYLEKGISLGAKEPQYMAWLAIALAEGGYREQSLRMARQLLSDPENQSIGRALVGQLRLRAGDYEAAAADIAHAVQSADVVLRPSLRLSQAEIALAQDKYPQAEPILAELVNTPVASQAGALEYRYWIRKKQPARADEVLSKVRTAHPDDATLLALDVRRLVERKQFSAALELLRGYEMRQPKSPVPAVLTAEVFELQRNPAAAIQALRKAIEKLPDEVALRVSLSEKLLNDGKSAEAGPVIEGLKGDPKINATTLDYLLARRASMDGDAEGAEEILRRAASRDPDNPTIKFLLGQVASHRGDHYAAKELFEQSLAAGAFPQQSMRELFDALLRTGDTDRALTLLGQAERQGQSIGPMRRRLLQLLARREQWNSMEREVDELLKSDPTEEEAALAVALLRYAKRQDRAEQVLQAAMAKLPDSAMLGEHQASLWIEQRKFGEAEGLLRRLLTKNPKSAGLHLLNVQLYLERGELEEAKKAVTAGWQASPGDSALEAVFVQTLLRLQRADEAMAFAVNARKQFPSLPHPKYLNARMLDSLGRSAEALPLLEDAVAEEPKNANIANHYVRLLAADEKNVHLDLKIEKLLEVNPDNQFLLGVLAELYAGSNNLAKSQALLSRIKDVERHATLIAYLKAAIATSKRDYQTAEKLLSAASANPSGHLPSTLLLARVRLEQDRKQDALAFASQVRRQRPSLEAGQVLYAKLLDELGRQTEAEAAAREYLTAQPRSRSMRLTLAQILVRKDPDSGRSQARRLVEAVSSEGTMTPAELEACVLVLIGARHADDAKLLVDRVAGASKDPLLLHAAGRAFLLLGDAEKAKRLADQSLSLDASSVVARMLQADCIVRLAGQRPAPLESAVEIYREVLRLQPGQSAAANNLAWVLGTLLKKPHRALEELQTAMPTIRSPNPDMPAELLDTIGTLHLLANHAAEAQRFLEAAAVREPSNPAIQFHLGQTYRQLRRVAQARVCFEKVLQLDRQGEWTKQIPRDSLQAN